MVEYGNGFGQVAGGSGGGGGGQSVDVGVSIGRFVNDSVHTISTMPPALLAVCVVGIFLGLILVKRAF